MACLYRDISLSVSPNSPSRRISRTAKMTARLQDCMSVVRSSEQTAQPSRGQLSWLKSMKVKSGWFRCCTLSRICSADKVIRRINSRFNEDSVTTGSMGLLANRWKEKLCSSSWANTLDEGKSGDSFLSRVGSTTDSSLATRGADNAAVVGTSSTASVVDNCVVAEVTDGGEGVTIGAGVSLFDTGAGPAVKEVDTGAATNPFSKLTTSTGLMSAAGSRSFILISSSEQDHL
mmetsp:Transcript_23496/g.33639  ORF Transcript_23496/g.33639 Transcript_23496/m.33639 type:complete len:232 (-) Transcript_23496:244-939(-)